VLIKRGLKFNDLPSNICQALFLGNGPQDLVGQCSLMVSKPVLKASMASALES